METDSSFVRTYSIVVLDAVAHVVAYLAVVVDPGNAESEYSVRDAKSLEEILRLKGGIAVVHVGNRADYLFHCLQVLGLAGKSLAQAV